MEGPPRKGCSPNLRLRNGLGWRSQAGPSPRLKAPALGWQLQAKGRKEMTPHSDRDFKDGAAIVLWRKSPGSELEPDIPWKWSSV